MAVNRIHNFHFVTLNDIPGTLREEVLVLARAGVDGQAIWKTGLRGNVFTLRSAVDAPSFADARLYLTQYQELIGADPVDLVWGGLVMTGEQIKVAVKSVRPTRLISLANSVGGINPPSYGWIECEWELVPISIAPDEEA